MFGVDQQTVSLWLGEEVVTNASTCVSYHPDSRVKIPKEEHAALIVDPPADELAEIQQARESNEASETVVKTTFVDDAELVWKLTESFTQEQAAKAMGGWVQPQIAQYKALKKICSDAWEIITGTMEPVIQQDDDAVIDDITGVIKSKFSENLLRNILDLHPSQQVELCEYLAKGKDKKGHTYNKAKFKQDAIWYRAFNILWDLADKQISAAIPDPVWPTSRRESLKLTTCKLGACARPRICNALT